MVNEQTYLKLLAQNAELKKKYEVLEEQYYELLGLMTASKEIFHAKTGYDLNNPKIREMYEAGVIL